MLSNQKIKRMLEEMRDISRVDLALYHADGAEAASTFDGQEDLASAVAGFAESMAESQTAFGFHFFKIMDRDVPSYILLAKASSQEAYVIGKLAACQFRRLQEACREHLDKNHFMQNAMLGNMQAADLYGKAKKLRIEQAERVVFVIEVEGKKDDAVIELVRGMFGGLPGDFIIEADGQSIAVIKDLRERTDDSLDGIARMMVDTLHSEAMVRVRVGYGNCVSDLADLAKSYQEAKMAIEVGKVFYAKEETFSYARLGIGRLIYQIPTSLCRMFIREIFGDEVPDVFSEENMVTIQTFFENNLNISETARQLFLHRNTLVYRLERLEKAIGLDIRKFEDAMTFKIAMMVLSHMRCRKE